MPEHGHHGHGGEMTPEQQKQMIALTKNRSEEELLEKHQYLSKMKLMAFFEQQRATRIAKIKSKQQRKYLKQQAEKLKTKKLMKRSK